MKFNNLPLLVFIRMILFLLLIVEAHHAADAYAQYHLHFETNIYTLLVVLDQIAVVTAYHVTKDKTHAESVFTLLHRNQFFLSLIGIIAFALHLTTYPAGIEQTKPIVDSIYFAIQVIVVCCMCGAFLTTHHIYEHLYRIISDNSASESEHKKSTWESLLTFVRNLWHWDGVLQVMFAIILIYFSYVVNAN